MFICYEMGQIDEACAWAQRGGAVVAFDFFVECELQKRGISVVSPQEFLRDDTGEEKWWELSQSIAREWYRLPAMSFFQYRDISIGEALEPMLESYLSRLFYYVRLLERIKDTHPHESLYIPAISTNSPATAGPLAFFEQSALVDAARMLHLQVQTSSSPPTPRKHLFPRAAWKSFFISLYNSLVSIAPRRSLRIYASEYWSHIAGAISSMKDTELVLMESSELKNISWRDILAHRIRVQHPADVATQAMKRNARTKELNFQSQWSSAETSVSSYLSSLHPNLDWQPLVEASGYLVAYSPRVITDIDALYKIMQVEKPHVVLQRASLGARQHHFFLMAQVARALGIPSVEVQHAAAYLDPRSLHSRIETTVLASYGPYTSAGYERLGYPKEKLVSVGSPRFDRCIDAYSGAKSKGENILRDLGIDLSRPVLLVAVPSCAPIANQITLDSYGLAQFFRDIHIATSSIKGLQVVFKFRSNGEAEPVRGYIKELFSRDFAIVGEGDLFSLLRASSAAIAGNSSVIYEALLADAPLLLYPWKSWDRSMKEVYVPAALMPPGAEQLSKELQAILQGFVQREKLITQGRSFLKGYAFDGRSAERMRALLQKYSGL